MSTAREYLRGTVTNPWLVGLSWLLVPALAVMAVRAATSGFPVGAVFFGVAGIWCA